MSEENGILIKFSGSWRSAVEVDEYFLPTDESISLKELMKKLEKIFGRTTMSHNDGFICLFDEKDGSRALKQEDDVSPGSKLLFLGTVESG